MRRQRKSITRKKGQKSIFPFQLGYVFCSQILLNSHTIFPVQSLQIRKLYGCLNIKLLQSRIIYFNRILQKYFARFKHILNVLIVSRASLIQIQNISVPNIFFYFSCYCKQLTSATKRLLFCLSRKCFIFPYSLFSNMFNQAEMSNCALYIVVCQNYCLRFTSCSVAWLRGNCVLGKQTERENTSQCFLNSRRAIVQKSVATELTGGKYV